MKSILHSLARAYEQTKAGRLGMGERNLILDYEAFLRESGCPDGESRTVAEQALLAAERAGLISLIRHRRDERLIEQLRFSPKQEAMLFDYLQIASPRDRRATLAQFFQRAGLRSDVPSDWRRQWDTFFHRLSEAALSGQSVQPFEQDGEAINQELVEVLAGLLRWNGESLRRFASCVICGQSKRLEQLQLRLERILSNLSENKINRLEDLGILENPRFVLVHGPLCLHLPGGELNLGVLSGPARLAIQDLESARLETNATRCLTVENETTFHELAKLQSGIILLQTSHPGRAVVAFLRKLPGDLVISHFGDTDPAGFAILRDLRERSGRAIQALHMRYRPAANSPALTEVEKRIVNTLLANPSMATEKADLEAMMIRGTKGMFEQESLGRPSVRSWPFYEQGE